jgi:CDP-glucose 4,6-dehydratase
MNRPLLDAFQGRTVFITGHTGFKGSWLTLWLDRLGAKVTGYSLPPPTEPSNYVSSGVGERLTREYNADTRDVIALGTALRESRPGIIFHLAAQPLVLKSFADPRETFEVNVMGTVNVLEAARNLGHACAVIIVTSDKCYENRERSQEHFETDPLGGDDPYSASKAAAEVVAGAYHHSFFSPEKLAAHGVKLATVRAGNVIGGGDWAADRIVPDSIRALMARRPILVRNPRSIRPWQHVLEPLSGYLTLASRMLLSKDCSFCGGWNFGPSAQDEATVQELVEALCLEWDEGAWQEAGGGELLREDRVLRLCSLKARAKLGWRTRWTFQETVARISRWYRAFEADRGRSTRELCLRDISEFEAAATLETDDLTFSQAQSTKQMAGRRSR